MDQLKDILREAVKHRFWIAVGISAILPLIAYFVGTGALAEEEKRETEKIKGAITKVKPFENGDVKNQAWTKAVTERTAELSKDVVASWQKLYERQAPLLAWPEPVRAKFMEWGRDYPKDVDPAAVRDVILDYTQVYPEYVEKVYKSFRPFDPEDGSGVVAAPPMSILLKPKVFQEVDLPTLGEVWTAQERLWIQATMLNVVSEVNKKAKAKDWDSAVVKQVLSLECASPLALDQKTNATDADALVSPPEILAPGQTSAATEKPAAPSAKNASEAAMGSTFMGAAAGGGGAADATVVKYVKSANADQYFIVPVAMKVYIEQDRIPDLLVAFKNSPMSIRVLDFEMRKPLLAVKKPRKGQNQAIFAGSMGGMGGGMFGDMTAGSRSSEFVGDNPMASGGYSGMGDSSAFAPGARGLRPGANKAKGRQGGQDVKKENIAKLQGKGKKDADKSKTTKDEEDEEPVFSNPYFNVVEVTIKGQARFYKAPPKVAAPDNNSPGATPPPANGDQPKPEPAKADETKAETPKADEKTDAAAKGEEPKAETPKADAAKAEPAKDAPAPKAEAPKDDAKPKDAAATPKA